MQKISIFPNPLVREMYDHHQQEEMYLNAEYFHRFDGIAQREAVRTARVSARPFRQAGLRKLRKIHLRNRLYPANSISNIASKRIHRTSRKRFSI